jgi:hypothetical protein
VILNNDHENGQVRMILLILSVLLKLVKLIFYLFSEYITKEYSEFDQPGIETLLFSQAFNVFLGQVSSRVDVLRKCCFTK